MNKTHFTLSKFKTDAESYKKELLKEARLFVESLSGLREVEDKNNQFYWFFNLDNHIRINWNAYPPEHPDVNYAYENTFTKSIITNFFRWADYLVEEEWMDYFKSDKKNEVYPNNLLEVQREQLRMYKSKDTWGTSYQDHELLKNPDLQQLYETIVKAFVLREIRGLMPSEESKDANYIDSCFSNFKKLSKDPFEELRKLNNNFNSASVDELIEFFSDLNHVAKGQSKPVISQEDFILLIKSICQKHLLADSINVNISTRDHAVIRRLFFDFFDTYQTRDKQTLVDPPRKIDYMKFIENFTPFKGKTSNKKWVKNSSHSSAKRTLDSILKN